MKGDAHDFRSPRFGVDHDDGTRISQVSSGLEYGQHVATHRVAHGQAELDLERPVAPMFEDHVHGTRWVKFKNDLKRVNFECLQCDQIGQFICLCGNFSKPVAIITLPKSPTFLGNFCKGVKVCYFLVKSFLGNFCRHLATFFRSRWLFAIFVPSEREDLCFKLNLIRWLTKCYLLN